jgi:hypothetical protein
MGRTLPSSTQLAFDLIAELKPFYGALRRSDQLILDKFFEDALQHRAAISNAASLLPMELISLVILLEEHKRINRRLDEVFSQILGQSQFFWKELEKIRNAMLPFDQDKE